MEKIEWSMTSQSLYYLLYYWELHYFPFLSLPWFVYNKYFKKYIFFILRLTCLCYAMEFRQKVQNRIDLVHISNSVEHSELSSWATPTCLSLECQTSSPMWLLKKQPLSKQLQAEKQHEGGKLPQKVSSVWYNSQITSVSPSFKPAPNLEQHTHN